MAIPFMARKNYRTTQADAILHFYKQLDPKFDLGEGIEIMNPFQDNGSLEIR